MCHYHCYFVTLLPRGLAAFVRPQIAAVRPQWIRLPRSHAAWRVPGKRPLLEAIRVTLRRHGRLLPKQVLDVRGRYVAYRRREQTGCLRPTRAVPVGAATSASGRAGAAETVVLSEHISAIVAGSARISFRVSPSA